MAVVAVTICNTKQNPNENKKQEAAADGGATLRECFIDVHAKRSAST
jgi:hypothetical protein